MDGWMERQTDSCWMDEQMNRRKDRWIDLRIDIKLDEWLVRTFMDQHERKLYFQNALAQLNLIKLTTLLSVLLFQITISRPVGCGQFNLHSWFKKEPIQLWILCNPGLKSVFISAVLLGGTEITSPLMAEILATSQAIRFNLSLHIPPTAWLTHIWMCYDFLSVPRLAQRLPSQICSYVCVGACVYVAWVWVSSWTVISSLGSVWSC